MLRGAPAGEDRDDHCAGPGIAGVVVVDPGVVGVVVPGTGGCAGWKRPIVIVTVDPRSTFLSPAGDCFCTSPSWSAVSTGTSSTPTSKPRPDSVFVAVFCERPT